MRKIVKNLIKNESGFNLVEISIAIIVIGIILSFSIKGYNLIKHANLVATVNQINQYKLAIQMYQNLFNRQPGLINQTFDENTFWEELSATNFIKLQLSEKPPKTKIGGNIQAKYSNNHIYLEINNVSPSQAYYIDSNIDDGNPTTGDLKCISEFCITGNSYNTLDDRTDCLIEIRAT